MDTIWISPSEPLFVSNRGRTDTKKAALDKAKQKGFL